MGTAPGRPIEPHSIRTHDGHRQTEQGCGRSMGENPLRTGQHRHRRRDEFQLTASGIPLGSSLHHDTAAHGAEGAVSPQPCDLTGADALERKIGHLQDPPGLLGHGTKPAMRSPPTPGAVPILWTTHSARVRPPVDNLATRSRAAVDHPADPTALRRLPPDGSSVVRHHSFLRRSASSFTTRQLEEAPGEGRGARCRLSTAAGPGDGRFSTPAGPGDGRFSTPAGPRRQQVQHTSRLRSAVGPGHSRFKHTSRFRAAAGRSPRPGRPATGRCSTSGTVSSA